MMARPVGSPMAEKRDKLLTNAGGLLIAAGAIGAFAGGSYGLAAQRPGFIITSLLLLMGYGVVGYLLMNRGARYFHYVLPASAVLVVATLLLFQGEMRRVLDEAFFQYILKPGITLLLAFAAGALLTHSAETMTAKVEWPSRGAQSINALLHVAAYAPIWCAFTLLDMMGGSTSGMGMLVVGGAALAAIGCSVGGYAAARGNHPALTVIGAGGGFLASAGFLYQFMAGANPFGGAAAFGQFNALLGLILTALPVAIGSVAWIQVKHGDIADAEEAPIVADEPTTRGEA